MSFSNFSKEGWLTLCVVKEGESKQEKLSTAKKYWVTLRIIYHVRPFAVLLYAKSDKEADVISGSGYVQLTNNFNGVYVDVEQDDGPNSYWFYIENDERSVLTVFLQATSNTERKDWIDALSEATKALPDGVTDTLVGNGSSPGSLKLKARSGRSKPPEKMRKKRSASDTKRTIYRLNFEVMETKNMMIHAKRRCRPHCIVDLDHEHIVTHSLPSSGLPILPETYILHFLSPTESQMRFSVWEGATYDRQVGQLEITMAEIGSAGNTVQRWLPLHAPPHVYVSGSCQLQWRYSLKDSRLFVTVLGARNLAVPPGKDKELTIKCVFGKEKERRASVKKDSDWAVQWDFAINNGLTLPLAISLWRRKNFLGAILLKPSDIEQNRTGKQWFVLKAHSMSGDAKSRTPSGSRKGALDDSADYGSVKALLQIKKVYLYPLHVYADLLQLFMEEIVPCLQVLDELSRRSEQERIASMILRIHEAKDNATAFLKALISHEVEFAEDVETLWRGSTVGSRALNQYMKTGAKEYLINVVTEVCLKVAALKKPFELKDGCSGPLIEILDKFLTSLYDKTDSCPTPLREIFYHLQHEAKRKFPSNPVVKYTSVSGFLFLRFINAALLAPDAFDIMEEPKPLVKQNLTHIAKIVQKISNIRSFGDIPDQMELHGFMRKQDLLIKLFIDAISTTAHDVPYQKLGKQDGSTLVADIAELIEFLESQIDHMIEFYHTIGATHECRPVIERLLKILDHLAAIDNVRAPRFSGLRCPPVDECRSSGSGRSGTSQTRKKKRRKESKSKNKMRRRSHTRTRADGEKKGHLSKHDS